MDRANCEGKNELEVFKGYWRQSLSSETIYTCLLAKACKGGFHPKNYHPIKCEKGYEGILCHHCVRESKEGERRYMRIGDHEC